MFRLLRQRGVYPWIDVEQIAPGRWFQDVIQSAIRKVKAAAVFFGACGLGPWQAVELRAFVERCVGSGIPLIPVLLPDVAAVPVELVFMQGLQHVKFERTVFEREALDQLEWGIKGVRPAAR